MTGQSPAQILSWTPWLFLVGAPAWIVVIRLLDRRSVPWVFAVTSFLAGVAVYGALMLFLWPELVPVYGLVGALVGFAAGALVGVLRSRRQARTSVRRSG